MFYLFIVIVHLSKQRECQAGLQGRFILKKMKISQALIHFRTRARLSGGLLCLFIIIVRLPMRQQMQSFCSFPSLLLPTKPYQG